jgi:hypothetical protein
MKSWLILAGMLAACLLGAPAALASTQTAQPGGVTATFTYQGHAPSYKGLRLSIARGGQVFYNAAVFSKWCRNRCWPALDKGPSVHVVDLEGNGQPDVVLDLYTGGAHCCTVEQIFSFDPGTMTYVKVERDFGDPGVAIDDLGHNGRYELLTADDLFAYEFTDFAASGLPIQIFSYSGGHFRDVTRSYPKLIAKDAALWLKAFKSMSKQGYQDSVGVIAAWAADEDLLGHSKLVSRYLTQQAKAGHLKTPLSPQEPGGTKFVAKLQKFLSTHSYLHAIREAAN